MSGPSGNQIVFSPPSPKTLMTLWPSKQITNIDSTAKNYKIYYFQR